ncbi:hypothetical protein GCM10027596_24340 [Nocardioides korecus]
MRVRNKIAGLAATVALTVAGTVATTTAPADASSYGCTGYGTGVTWQGMYVRNGTFCSYVSGSSTYVNYVTGNFFVHIPGPDQLCNYSIKADFYDAYGNWYTWKPGSIHWGCSWNADTYSVPIYSWMRRGSVRVTLLSNGYPVAAIRESIY